MGYEPFFLPTNSNKTCRVQSNSHLNSRDCPYDSLVFLDVNQL